MSDPTVVIVGAGPAGLALALSLARFRIHSVILERESSITEDPRGVYLTPDAVRILYDIGLGSSIDKIGHAIPHVFFHETSFSAKPFYSIEANSDSSQQAMTNGILQFQPYLEKCLRDAVVVSEFCDLRHGCEVVDRSHRDRSILVTYKEKSGLRKQVLASWLIGADGKKGVVRKHFLEKSAGIMQVHADYRYEGTWVASNFEITPPTPETHPDFPLWKYDYSPQQVFDLFWPEGWHFACPPGKATASGRFGPEGTHFWRHEFEQSDWNDDMDSETLLWEHLLPMVTRSTDLHGRKLACGAVVFPRDCISILRCRPFTFAHKVVNRWFDDCTILIGDAAHVFPPFGGQGIASGIRDAHQLAWRLALFDSCRDPTPAFTDSILSAWATERTSSVKDAALVTQMNGQLCIGDEPLGFKLFRWLDTFLKAIPYLPNFPSPLTSLEKVGLSRVKGGFHDTHLSGGGRVAQVWVASADSKPILSDRLSHGVQSLMTLLVVGNQAKIPSLVTEAQRSISTAGLSSDVLNKDSIVSILQRSNSIISPISGTEKVWWVCEEEEIDQSLLIPGYNPSNYFDRFGTGVCYVILRPDFYIYAKARTAQDLSLCLARLKSVTLNC